MTFASKINDGGQFTAAIDLCINLCMLTQAECKENKHHLNFTYDFKPLFPRMAQKSSRLTQDPNSDPSFVFRACHA